MDGKKQNVKTYKLNKDYTVECVMGDSMTVRVVVESLIWRPVMEEYVGIKDKAVANETFKRMVEKYRLPVESVLIR